MLGSWLEEYDELASDVENSTYQTFQLNAQRWLDFIDSHNLIEPYVAQWEQSVDFAKWYAENNSSDAQMNGNGTLVWPADAKQRLALQFGLFRRLASGEIHFLEFARVFFWTDGNFNAHTKTLNQQFFRPFQRELRRRFQALDLSNPPTSDEPFIPASDRVVTLDHNSVRYSEVEAYTRDLLDGVRGANAFDDPADREQRIVELEATNILVTAPRMRYSVFRNLIEPCLKWLVLKFADQTVGILAAKLLAALAAWLGFSL